MTYSDPSETNYFIEVHPGDELSNEIFVAKRRLSSIPESQYVGDDPHFTMIAARTAHMRDLIEATHQVSHRFEPLEYRIIDMEERQYPNDMVEIRTVVHEDDRRLFKDVHMAVIEASVTYKSKSYMDRYDPSAMSQEQLENLEYCGFPNARNLFAPHASIGRFKPETLEEVRRLLDGFDLKGTYVSHKMIIWRLPSVAEDPKETPEKIEELLFSV